MHKSLCRQKDHHLPDLVPQTQLQVVREEEVCDHSSGSHQTPNNPGFGQSQQGQEEPPDLHRSGEGGAPLGSVCCQSGCLRPQPALPSLHPMGPELCTRLPVHF